MGVTMSSTNSSAKCTSLLYHEHIIIIIIIIIIIKHCYEHVPKSVETGQGGTVTTL
jgi:hypothetical protein